MMSKKQLLLIVVMMGVLFATAFANENNDAKKDRSEQIKERYTFFKENVKPKVDAQRNKFEASISAEDKQEIEKLRTEIMKQRLLENEFRFEIRESRIKGEPFDEGVWQELEAQRIVIENLLDKAKVIANKYRPEIDDLVSDLRGDIRDEFQEIRDENRPNRNRTGEGYGRGRRGDGPWDGKGDRYFGRGHRGEFGQGRGYHQGFGFGMPGARGSLDIVGFLLWDVNKG
jgi:gas vesicle protein